MAEELNYKRLRELARLEKSQSALSRMEPEFYGSIAAFLDKNFARMEESPSVIQMREFENATSTIREISLIRQQKILFQALRNPGQAPPEGEMTREEYAAFDRFSTIVSEERGRLDALLARFEERRAKTREGKPPERLQAAPQGEKLKKLRFTKEVQAYVGMNRETIGPFKQGEEGSLPSEEAELLLKQKMAETIE